MKPDVSTGACIAIDSSLKTKKSIITLGDIAVFSGMPEEMVKELSGIEIGKAPSPGSTRTLSLAIVRVRLRQAGYDPDDIEISGPVTIMVSTQSTEVTSGDIETSVKNYIKENMPWDLDEIEISVNPIADKILVPDGDIEIKVEALPSTKFLGTTSLKAQILADGEVSKTYNVRLRIDVVKEVVVATRTIQRHEIISEDDLSLEARDLSGIRSDVVFDPLLAVGMMAKNTIQFGKAIAFSNIQYPPDVTRGDLVTLEAKVGGVVVKTPGEILETGAVGDFVRVKNLSSGVIVRAKVIDSQSVLGI